ncbi:MAG: hypothetical protein ACTSR8_03535 [Promethearchaeota archaeon]
MSILAIPVAPLSKAKSRLNECFSREQIRDLIKAMLRDMYDNLKSLDLFNVIIIYSQDREILELAATYNFMGIREIPIKQSRSFDDVISELKDIAIAKFKSEPLLISFLDLPLINQQHFSEINSLLHQYQIVVCPAIKTAGISLIGANPPSLLPPCFSDPKLPSLITLYNNAREKGISQIYSYDSFQAGFDIDLREDCLLAVEYMKIFDLTERATYKFLKTNLNHCFEKIDENNNRSFKFVEKK